MARVYLVRDEHSTVVCRRRPRMRGVRSQPRSWRALAELPPAASRTSRQPGDTAVIFAPPVALGAMITALASAEVGIAVGGATLVASTYFTPLLRRRAADWIARRRLSRPDTVVLTGEAERSAFGRALGVADRISDTWPALSALIDVGEAEVLLAEALWEIALILGRRQELEGMLAELRSAGLAREQNISGPAKIRPARPPSQAGSADRDPSRSPAMLDPGSSGSAPVPVEDTTGDVRVQVDAVKAARARIEAELAGREASLRRAEQAGRDFIREQGMRRAVRAAEDTLRTTPSGVASASVALDAGADLAEHTRSVLTAYRELTAGPRPD